MNFQNFMVPYLSKADIYKAAEIFREKYWNNTIPVDIETIIDVKLKINIVTKPELLKLKGFDAFITSDWQHMVVDDESYRAGNNRLRFSYAHEVGHLILHKNLFERFKIKDSDDITKFHDELTGDQHHFIEVQANNFANYLLIPRDKLREIKIKVLNKFLFDNNIDISKIDPKTLNEYMAGPIAKYFGVSPTPLEIALADLNK